MIINLITAATVEPITLAELKQHLKIDVGTLADNSAEDALLNGVIAASRAYVESITRRQLVTATWEYKISSWPKGNAIKLPKGNLESVTYVKYLDEDGDETTMTVTTDYLVETNGNQCGQIVLPCGEAWPSSNLYPSNPISIKFVCGYGLAASVPDSLKTAIKFECELNWNHGGEDDMLRSRIDTLSANYRLHDEF